MRAIVLSIWVGCVISQLCASGASAADSCVGAYHLNSKPAIGYSANLATRTLDQVIDEYVSEFRFAREKFLHAYSASRVAPTAELQKDMNYFGSRLVVLLNRGLDILTEIYTRRQYCQELPVGSSGKISSKFNAMRSLQTARERRVVRETFLILPISVVSSMEFLPNSTIVTEAPLLQGDVMLERLVVTRIGLQMGITDEARRSPIPSPAIGFAHWMDQSGITTRTTPRLNDLGFTRITSLEELIALESAERLKTENVRSRKSAAFGFPVEIVNQSLKRGGKKKSVQPPARRGTLGFAGVELNRPESPAESTPAVEASVGAPSLVDPPRIRLIFDSLGNLVWFDPEEGRRWGSTVTVRSPSGDLFVPILNASPRFVRPRRALGYDISH